MCIAMKFQSFKSIGTIWKLFEKESELSPIQYYEYNYSLYKSYFFYRIRYLERPLFACFYENNECIAIAPLCKKTTLKGTEVVGFGNCPTIPIYDWICKKTITDDQIKKCLDLLIKKFKKMRFNRVSSKSRIYSVLKDNYKIYDEKENVVINVKEYEEYFNELSKSSRQNIRTAYNRLKKNELSYSIEKYNGPIDSLKNKEVMSVYEKRRNSKYKNDNILRKILIKHFHHTTLSLKNDSNSIIYCLRINGYLAAFWGGLINKKNNYIIVPRLAINEKYSWYSPGLILINETMKELQETSVKYFDLSMGSENYKYVMGGKKYATYNFLVK